jgi:hypothetical protein
MCLLESTFAFADFGEEIPRLQFQKVFVYRRHNVLPAEQYQGIQSGSTKILEVGGFAVNNFTR